MILTEAAMLRKKQSGQVLIGVAFAMVVLAGFAGLAVDMGTIRYQRRLQQTAADAAAIAGANELRRNGGLGINPAALNATSANGFSNTAGDISNCATPGAAVGMVCVQIVHAPGNVTLPDGTVILGGPHNGNVNYVETLVGAVQPTYFMKIFGLNSQFVWARAVATNIGQSSNSGGCVYTLGPPGTGVGVTNSGTPTLNAPTCGIEDAGDFTTNGKKVNITAGFIGAAGDVENHGGGSVLCGSPLATCDVVNIPPPSDPLSFLQPPSVGVPVAWTGNPIPGTTYSSITINSTDVVNFPAGTYIVDGSFTINGGASVCNQASAGCSSTGVQNAGVTFYVTNGGTVKTNGTSNIFLSAPDSGTYAGVLFYQDANDTSTAIMDGTANSFFQGALYFPTAELDFGGTITNTTAAYTVIVANDLKLNGTATVNLNSNYASLPGGVSIIENAVLVE
jgi:Putative Flp pilus-assembly TadE/G-like